MKRRKRTRLRRAIKRTRWSVASLTTELHISQSTMSSDPAFLSFIWATPFFSLHPTHGSCNKSTTPQYPSAFPLFKSAPVLGEKVKERLFMQPDFMPAPCFEDDITSPQESPRLLHAYKSHPASFPSVLDLPVSFAEQPAASPQRAS